MIFGREVVREAIPPVVGMGIMKLIRKKGRTLVSLATERNTIGEYPIWGTGMLYYDFGYLPLGIAVAIER